MTDGGFTLLMDEIKEITDRVTIMRDGRYIDTLITADSTKEEIISGMVGRVIYEDPKTESRCPSDAPVVLKVERLNAGKLVRDVSFELRKGEILGFAGLVGAGRTETLRALFGADPKQGGEIWIDGIKTEIRSPKDAVKAGISYLSEDACLHNCPKHAIHMPLEAGSMQFRNEHVTLNDIIQANE